MSNTSISLSVIPGVQLLDNEEFLAKLAELFSTNYGTWSNKGPRPGQPVAMSVKLMKQMLLFNAEASGVVVATSCEQPKVVGHAFYYKFSTEKLGKVCWITQLVTCRDVRHRGVASSMIRAAFSCDCAVCGLVTSHPYAIRALEKATSCKCNRKTIEKYARELIENCRLPYVDSKAVVDSHGSIDTQFHVDHMELFEIIERERVASRWDFGQLLDGHEFFAFVFVNLDKEGHES